MCSVHEELVHIDIVLKLKAWWSGTVANKPSQEKKHMSADSKKPKSRATLPMKDMAFFGPFFAHGLIIIGSTDGRAEGLAA